MGKSSPKGAGKAATPAIAALVKAGVKHQVHHYDHDEQAHARGLKYGMEAATELGLAPERVFKTLVAQVEGVGLAVAIVPVAAQVDLKAFALACGGKKANLADPELAQRATGYVVGGISPIGQRKLLPTVIDASALAHETIFVSGGKRGLDVELAPGDLVHILRANSASIAAE